MPPFPLQILREAIRAVPAVKYALGVAGVVAVVSIIKLFGLDLWTAFAGAAVIFVLMIVLVVFARISKFGPTELQLPALVLMWSFLVLMIAATTLLFTSAFWGWPLDFVNRQRLLYASTLKRMEMYIQRDGNGPKIEPYLLVASGEELEPPPINPLRARDGLKLVAQFSEPSYWYLLWFDTRGQVKVQAHSNHQESGMEYPAGANYVSIDEADPAGIHLLLLVAGSTPPGEGTRLLEEQLRSLGKPPQVLPPRWSQLRGGGPVIPGGTVPLTYLNNIDAQLPQGLKSLHALFLSSKPTSD
jgi:hypothetical protein